MKKVITLIITLVLAFCLFGCDGCSKDTDKENPTLTDGNVVLASLSETVGSTTYKYEVTKNDAYNMLKANYGSSALVNMIDREILSKIKNSNDKTYIEAVTEDDLKAEIDKNVYGEDPDYTDLSETEIEEAKAEDCKDFLDTLLISYGLTVTDIYDEQVKDIFRLTIAQKAYAKDMLKKEITDTDKAYNEYIQLSDEAKAEVENPVVAPYYTDTKVAAKYDAEHMSSYKAIVVPFSSLRQATIALAQCGVTIKNGVWTDGTNVLAAQSVFEKFIELYKVVYGYKVTEELTKDSTDFDYTESELSTLNADVLAYVKDNMAIFDNDSKNEDPDWYTVTPYEAGSGKFVTFILKFGEIKVDAYADLTKKDKEDAKEKYLDELMKDSLTTNYILTKLAELREEKKLVIYDSVIESAYISSISSLGVTHEKTEEVSTDTIGSIDGYTVKINDFFNAMLEQRGESAIIDKLAEKRILVNPELNPYYDYAQNKWLDSTKKDEILSTIKAEKQQFENGSYTSDGYDPASMSWDVYYKSVYDVGSEEELELSFLAADIDNTYKASLNSVAQIKKTDSSTTLVVSEEEALKSKLWAQMSADMEKAASEAFSSKGIQLIICSYDTVADRIAGTNPTDATKWDDNKKAAAKELYDEIVAYVADTKGTYASRFDKIVEAFKYSPLKDKEVTYAENNVALTLTSDNGKVIHVAKYKALGFDVKSENLGTFSNGSHDEAFDAAVKKIWDNDASNYTFNNATLKELDKITVNDSEIITAAGYHFYVNLESLELSYAHKNEITKEEGELFTRYSYVYTPTLQEIRKYAVSTTDSTLSTSVKSAITKYYTPIANELTGTYFHSIAKYNDLSLLTNGSSFTCTFSGVNAESIKSYIALFAKYYFENNLEHVTAEYLVK